IDLYRKAEPLVPVPPATIGPDQSMEVRDAARQLISLLPPQERAAVVLKDVFDFHIDEISAILQTTVGAIKAALHRGREKLATPNRSQVAAGPSEALLDQFVDAFNARDLDRLAALLRAEAVAETVGMGTSHGREPIRDSSLYYCLFLEKGEPRAERQTFEGEPIVIIWYADLDDPTRRAVREVFRFEEIDGHIARLCFYGFCPETEIEILTALGVPFAPLGYGVWALEFLRLRKEKEFQEWRASEHPEWVEKN
ncbi:MAG: sigma factor-like helix-turn-helix DNA-binding protein, partial [Blastocatellia bacterium]